MNKHFFLPSYLARMVKIDAQEDLEQSFCCGDPPLWTRKSLWTQDKRPEKKRFLLFGQGASEGLSPILLRGGQKDQEDKKEERVGDGPEKPPSGEEAQPLAREEKEAKEAPEPEPERERKAAPGKVVLTPVDPALKQYLHRFLEETSAKPKAKAKPKPCLDSKPRKNKRNASLLLGTLPLNQRQPGLKLCHTHAMNLPKKSKAARLLSRNKNNQPPKNPYLSKRGA